jgi:hypothetical protein
MGELKAFHKECLVVAVLSTLGDEGRKGIDMALAESLGPIAYSSPSMPFDATDHFEAEMGAGIERFFLAFENLVEPSTLSGIKIQTNSIEAEFTHRGKRRVNLDPGLLSLGRYVIATTKDRSHRIPLADGVYGELALTYEGSSWKALPWTYPDFRSESYWKVLSDIRSLMKGRLIAS